ncbi:unnamed protein product [Rhizophagus irregularis]|nr:unnamed protein product [Rhizophagus irregularis]
MKKCWDLNPSNRPTIIILENIITEWIRCINEFYETNRDENYNYRVPGISNHLKNDIFEFVKVNKALVQEQANTSIIQFHPQAYYINRNVTKEIEKSKNVSERVVQENSDLLDCIFNI